MNFLNPREMHHLYPISVLVTTRQNFGSSAAGTMQSKYTKEEQGRKILCCGVGTWREYLFQKAYWIELLGMTLTDKFSTRNYAVLINIPNSLRWSSLLLVNSVIFLGFLSPWKHPEPSFSLPGISSLYIQWSNIDNWFFLRSSLWLIVLFTGCSRPCSAWCHHS